MASALSPMDSDHGLESTTGRGVFSMMDNLNAPAAGSSFSIFRSDDLPAEPGAYEDFDYTNHLDYGFFPSTSSASLFANPFSPSSFFQHAGGVSTPGGEGGSTTSHQSHSLLSPVAGMTPGMTENISTGGGSGRGAMAPAFPSSSSATPSMTTTSPGGMGGAGEVLSSFINGGGGASGVSEIYSRTTMPNEPLFDDTETELFTSFLDTIDIDQNFLFNPVLPPGMPSPPPSIDRLPTGQERWERDRLGHNVGKMTLSGPPPLYNNHEGHRHDLGQEGEGIMDKEREEDPSNGDDRTTHSIVIQDEFTSPSGRKTRGPTTLDEEEGGRGASRGGKKFKGEMITVKHEGDITMDHDDNGVGGGSSNAATPTAHSSTSASRSRQRRAAGGPRTSLSNATQLSTSPNDNRSRPSHFNNSDSNNNNDNYNDSMNASRTTSLISASAPSPLRPSSMTSARPALAVDDQPDSGSAGGSSDGDLEDPDSIAASNLLKGPMTDSQKRSNHILSEQRRRNAIRSGFKDLVDLLTAGEAASGIVVAPDVPLDDEGLPKGVSATGKRRKGKSSGRGRGRKGEVGAGASKSVVLEKATAYIMWLERGNQALEEEVNRVETVLGGMGIRA